MAPLFLCSHPILSSFLIRFTLLSWLLTTFSFFLVCVSSVTCTCLSYVVFFLWTECYLLFCINCCVYHEERFILCSACLGQFYWLRCSIQFILPVLYCVFTSSLLFPHVVHVICPLYIFIASTCAFITITFM